jgi:hemolysin III
VNDSAKIKRYSPIEEKYNIISHAVGFILSIIASVLLVNRAILYGNACHIFSFSLFGASLIILYASSTFYHSVEKPELRIRLRVIDHASIYILIAGTYTPFTLITLKGATGWVIFSISWGLALTGIILKLLFIGKYSIFSTIMYILMGWVIVFALKPLIHNLPLKGVIWLFSGGISYTIGAILYSLKMIKLNHAIFHIFVLIGSFCHFMSVFFYVLPGD